MTLPTVSIAPPNTYGMPRARMVSLMKYRALILSKRPTIFNLDKPKATRIDGLGTKYPFAHASGIYTEARDAMLSGQPYQLRAGVFMFQNFVMSVPNTKKNIEAIKKLDYVVVFDTMMSETARLADIVIPGSHYLERWGGQR